MTIPRCIRCDSPDVIAIAPGCDDECAEIGIVVRPGVAARAWCLEHWPCAPLQRSLFDTTTSAHGAA